MHSTLICSKLWNIANATRCRNTNSIHDEHGVRLVFLTRYPEHVAHTFSNSKMNRFVTVTSGTNIPWQCLTLFRQILMSTVFLSKTATISPRTVWPNDPTCEKNQKKVLAGTNAQRTSLVSVVRRCAVQRKSISAKSIFP